MSCNPYPSWQRRHEAVLTWVLENPAGRQYECAEATGYSEWQVNRIVNSPDFQKRYERILDHRAKLIVEKTILDILHKRAF